MRMNVDIDVDSFHRKIEECKDYGYNIDETLEAIKESISFDTLTVYGDNRVVERKAELVFVEN